MRYGKSSFSRGRNRVPEVRGSFIDRKDEIGAWLTFCAGCGSESRSGHASSASSSYNTFYQDLTPAVFTGPDIPPRHTEVSARTGVFSSNASYSSFKLPNRGAPCQCCSRGPGNGGQPLEDIQCDSGLPSQPRRAHCQDLPHAPLPLEESSSSSKFEFRYRVLSHSFSRSVRPGITPNRKPSRPAVSEYDGTGAYSALELKTMSLKETFENCTRYINLSRGCSS